MLLTDVGEAVVVDGVERAFYLAPFVRIEGDNRIAALVEFLHHFRAFEDELLQECHYLVGLVQEGLLVFSLLLEPLPSLLLQTDAIAQCQHDSKEDGQRSKDDDEEGATIHL